MSTALADSVISFAFRHVIFPSMVGADREQAVACINAPWTATFRTLLQTEKAICSSSAPQVVLCAPTRFFLLCDLVPYENAQGSPADRSNTLCRTLTANALSMQRFIAAEGCRHF